MTEEILQQKDLELEKVDEKALYLSKLELMEKEGYNIPFTKEEMKSLPIGFTETSKFLTKQQLKRINKN